jgi:hypothetical protein
MRVSEGGTARVFVIRLEDGDMVPTCIERFAHQQGVSVAHMIMVEGVIDHLLAPALSNRVGTFVTRLVSTSPPQRGVVSVSQVAGA